MLNDKDWQLTNEELRHLLSETERWRRWRDAVNDAQMQRWIATWNKR